MKKIYYLGLIVVILFFLFGLSTFRVSYEPVAAAPLLADCVVTTTADSGAGSLRACLSQLSNGDTITFDTGVFPVGDPQSILPTSGLPEITADDVTLDAANAGVILDGASILGVFDGLAINGASGVTIRGLQIQNFSDSGISLINGVSNATIGGSNALFGNACDGACNVIINNLGGGIAITGGSQGNTITGNTIGTDRAGVLNEGNSDFGIEISGGSPSNVITGNLISGNLGPGVILSGSNTTDNTISANRIGVNRTGTGLIANIRGVVISGEAASNTVANNLISGNSFEGVQVTGSGTTANVISNNDVGTDSNGTTFIRNRIGVSVENGAQSNVITANLVSGNTNVGIALTGGSTMSNTVMSNDIGTNRTGTGAVGNVIAGVMIDDDAQMNMVSDNLISGNNICGVVIRGANNTISNNFIGTNRDGTAAISNGFGVELSQGAQANMVMNNLVSGNVLPGVVIEDINTSGNMVMSNSIGTDVTGSTGLSNRFGVFIANGAQANLVDDNLVSFNDRSGVAIFGEATVGNTLQQNRIANNADKGIALLNGGNAGLRPPGLTSVGFDTVSGVAVPGSAVEIYSDTELQGQNFEGSVVADANGDFTFTQPGGFASNNITAIATDDTGSTSEFSGNGGGIFEESGQLLSSSVQAFSSSNSRALALGDLNLDGQIDAFIVNDINLEIWFNDGNGVYSLDATYDSSAGQDVALGDFDRDGDPDAVVGRTGNLQIWVNDGDGNFTLNSSLGNSNTQAVAVGDFNADTYPDIVAGNDAGQANETWINDGGGDFNPGDMLDDSDAEAIGLGDLDNDEDLDIVIGNEDDEENQVWVNDGGGQFDSGGTLGDSDAEAIGLGDLDNDEDLDIVIGNEDDEENQVWINDGGGQFDPGGVLGDSDSEAIVLGDLNSDGFLDIFVGNGGDQGDQVWVNDGEGNFDDEQDLPGGDSEDVDLGDVDNDNDLDIFVVNGSGQVSQILLNQNKVLLRTGPAGGMLTAVTTQGFTTKIEVPPGVLSENTTLIYAPLAEPPHPFADPLRFANRAFSLDAEQADGPVADPFDGAINITVDHDAGEPLPTELLLYYWQEMEQNWLDAATTCAPTSAYSRGDFFVKVGICHLSDFSLFGPPIPIYLPTVLKN